MGEQGRSLREGKEEDLIKRMANILLVRATFSEVNWNTNKMLAEIAAADLMDMVKDTLKAQAASERSPSPSSQEDKRG